MSCAKTLLCLIAFIPLLVLWVLADGFGIDTLERPLRRAMDWVFTKFPGSD